MKTLFILNDAPYGTERSYNGLRLAKAVSKLAGQQVQVFLMGDAVEPRRVFIQRHALEVRNLDI